MIRKHRPLKINIASGVHVFSDYINYDNNFYLLLTPFRSILKYVLKKSRFEQIEKINEAKQQAPLIYRDCTKRLRYSNNSVDEIYSSHFLEHVYRNEITGILKDFHRVLKIGGKLVIIVPDLEVYISQYLNAEEGKDKGRRADQFIEKTLLAHPARPSFRNRIANFLKFNPRHNWLYDAGSMSALVKSCGFKNVKTERIPEETLKVTATK